MSRVLVSMFSPPGTLPAGPPGGCSLLNTTLASFTATSGARAGLNSVQEFVSGTRGDGRHGKTDKEQNERSSSQWVSRRVTMCVRSCSVDRKVFFKGSLATATSSAEVAAGASQGNR